MTVRSTWPAEPCCPWRTSGPLTVHSFLAKTHTVHGVDRVFFTQLATMEPQDPCEVCLQIGGEWRLRLCNRYEQRGQKVKVKEKENGKEKGKEKGMTKSRNSIVV